MSPEAIFGLTTGLIIVMELTIITFDFVKLYHNWREYYENK